MISQFKAPPFEHQARVFVTTDEDYVCANENDNIIDGVGTAIDVTLPPNPVYGQKVRVNAATNDVQVHGGTNAILGGATVLGHGSSEYTFTGSGWVANCCTTGIG